MKRKLLCFALALCMLLGACLLAGCGGSDDSASKELNIMTYEGWIPQVSIDAFEKAYNVKVNFTAADSDETMLDKVQSAKGGTYDIVLVDDYIVPKFSQGGLLHEIDSTKISNYKNINARYQKQYYDENDQYTIPYCAGYTFIVYDTEKIKTPITKYADLWRADLKNSIVTVDSYRVLDGITLMTLGHSMNTTDKTQLAAAAEKLKALRPNIKLFNSDTPHEALINGDATVGLMASSQAVSALAGKESLKAVYPTDGLGYGLGILLMPKNAPHVDLAYQFLDFILDGKNNAAAMEAINYIGCNTAADAFYSEAYKSNEAVFPPKEALERVTPEAVMDVDDETNRLLEEMYNAFRNAG